MSTDGDSAPDVTWCATSAETGRMGHPVRSTLREVAAVYQRLRDRGQGYLELEPDVGSPVLTLGFTGERAVIHLLATDAERSFLLRGDGSEAEDVAVEVPVMEEVGVFSGAFAHPTDRAWRLAQEFVRCRDATALGEWFEL